MLFLLNFKTEVHLGFTLLIPKHSLTPKNTSMLNCPSYLESMNNFHIRPLLICISLAAITFQWAIDQILYKNLKDNRVTVLL